MNVDRNLHDRRVLDGMAAQGRRRADLLAGGARPTGWKAGLGTVAAMDRVGTGAPVAGFLTDATRVADGGRVALDGWTAPTFEPELAIRLDRRQQEVVQEADEQEEEVTAVGVGRAGVGEVVWVR